MNKREQPLNIVHASMSDTGLQRKENQDAFGRFSDGESLLSEKGQLFIVADGMGGHERGSEASTMAVKTVKEFYSQSSLPIPLSLKRSVEEANRVIYGKAQLTTEIVRMGTTCVALLLTGRSAYIAHVGDSRVYRINTQGIEQVTEDHSQVAEMRRQGILTEEEAANHPSKSVLSRALGMKREVEVDMLEIKPIKPGDHFLLCTDGLSNVQTQDIRDVVLVNNPHDACEKLIGLANQTGGHDNVTVQVVKVIEDTDESETTDSDQADIAGKASQFATRTLLFMLLLAIGYGAYSLLTSRQDRAVSSIQELAFDNGAADITENAASETGGDEFAYARQLIRIGQFDSALAIYQSALRRQPMHLSAIQGIQRISEIYREQGDFYRTKNQYESALEQYRRASVLQPKNNEYRRLVAITREYLSNREQFTEASMDRPNISGEPTPGPTDTTPVSSEEPVSSPETEFSGLRQERWVFPNLTEEDYSLMQNRLKLNPTETQKKILSRDQLIDIDVKTEVHKLDQSPDSEHTIGIIIGYQNAEPETESYFLFSTADGINFVLKKITSEEEQILLTHSLIIVPEKSSDYSLKAKCLGPWIMIYRNDRLMKAWLGEDIIEGQIGLYADAGTSVEFSGIQVSSALTLGDDVSSENSQE